MTQTLSSYEVRELFSPASRHQSWLDVEAAMAAVQAGLGMIPATAAAEIGRKARMSCIDEAAFCESAERTHAPVLALAEALADVCDGAAGDFVHWGATTQNIIQTARIVQMRKAHEALLRRLGSVFLRLAAMADESAAMLAAGRSNRRQGLPITFGFKVAAWIDEMQRHEQRLMQVEDRAFVSQFGGALGAMHAFGDDGPAVNRGVSERLGLKATEVPVRSALDHIVEYIQLLALVGGSCSKVATELYLLMTDEFGEVIEDLEGAIGSSTMPQKVNSKIAVRVIAAATRLRGYALTTLEAMQPSHEGDSASNLVMSNAIDEAVPLAYELMCDFERLLACTRLQPEAMQRNVERSDGLIVAEKAMMLLAPHVGRNRAHHLVQESVAQVQQRRLPFAVALAGHPELPAALATVDLQAELQPASYTGQSVPLAKQSVERARAAAARLGAS